MTTQTGVEWKYTGNGYDEYWSLGDWEPFVSGPRGLAVCVGRRPDWTDYGVYLSSKGGPWEHLPREPDLESAKDRALIAYLQALLGEA